MKFIVANPPYREPIFAPAIDIMQPDEEERGHS